MSSEPATTTGTGETDARSRDRFALAQLWTGQFQQLTTLGIAGAGGIFVLVQSGLASLEGRWWIGLVCFALTAAFGIQGQIAVIDDATADLAPGRKPRVLRILALMSLGAGAGAVAAILLA